ncbi:MAG: right-handed parallel beta-helix repeat-containing protein [Methanothrix sp.]
MKLNGKWLIVYIIALIALIQGAYGGIQVTASGGVSGESGSVLMNYDTLKSTSVSSQIAIGGATITPSTTISGLVATFEETHGVTDASGKSASVYVKVVNAPDGLTYATQVLPGEGNVDIQSEVSAEQWLTVPKADFIKCTATASYGILSANVGLEEYKGTLKGDYVTLTEYYGKAVTADTLVLASQTATSGEANSIKIYGTAKDSSGTYKVDTPIKGISGDKATFAGLSETSSAGTITQVAQEEHVHGTFTSTATYMPKKVITKTKTRTSAYGTEYDINMNSGKGSLPTGYLGYYIKPGMKIQSAVNVAFGGDTVNVAAGTYKENVKIYKSLTVKGAGKGKTIVDGGGIGSVFTLGRTCVDNRNKNINLEGLNIKNGNAPYGGGIANVGCNVALTDVTLTGNTAKYGGGAICSTGIVTMNSGSITKNTANIGGGIYNYFGTVNLKGGSITGNTANSRGGAIYSSNSRVTFDGTQVVVKSNKAGLPSPPELSWYKGWGVYLSSGIPTITGGFHPATQVTGNTHI